MSTGRGDACTQAKVLTSREQVLGTINALLLDPELLGGWSSGSVGQRKGVSALDVSAPPSIGISVPLWLHSNRRVERRQSVPESGTEASPKSPVAAADW